MTKADLHDIMTNLVMQRRPLGGFDANAEAILVIAEVLLEVVKRLPDDEVKPKKRKSKRPGEPFFG